MKQRFYPFFIARLDYDTVYLETGVKDEFTHLEEFLVSVA